MSYPELPFKIKIVPVTPFQQNCSILVAPSGKAVVVDPGGETDRLLQIVDDMGGKVEKIWLTHGHLDHAGGAAEMRRKTGCSIEGPQEKEVFWLDQIRESWEKYGYQMGENVRPDRWLTDGDQVSFSFP